MNKLSDEELIKLHDSNIVAGLTIHNFSAAKNTKDLLLSRLAKGRKAIEAMERIRQNIPIPVPTKGWKYLLSTGYSIFENMVVDIFKAYDKE